MAQKSATGERKAGPKRRRRTGAPAKPEGARGDASGVGLAADLVTIGITAARGSVAMAQSKHTPNPEGVEGLNVVYTYDPDSDPFGPSATFESLHKMVFATSSMTPTPPHVREGFLKGGRIGPLYDNALGGGARPPLLDLHGRVSSDAEREQEAVELLKAARNAESDLSLRSVRRRFEERVFSDAVDALGGARGIGMAIRDEADLLRAIGLGFPALVLTSLRQLGFRSDDLEGVIAPRRTLARRRAGGQRLTRVESDAAWRLAHVISLGARVLRSPEAAMAWLRRPKAALGDQAPIDLIETAVGAQAVERLLFQLEWGDVA